MNNWTEKNKKKKLRKSRHGAKGSILWRSLRRAEKMEELPWRRDSLEQIPSNEVATSVEELKALVPERKMHNVKLGYISIARLQLGSKHLGSHSVFLMFVYEETLNYIKDELGSST